MGYVGLSLACMLAKRYKVIGYDHDGKRVEELISGNDSTGNVDADVLRARLRGNLTCTSNKNDIAKCNVYVVAVPTPVDKDNRPDIEPLRGACLTAGSLLKKGDVVIYESTVYPGMTEQFCVPLLAQTSGLCYNTDFFVGYSPERISPGDREHTVEKIKKVTSGSTPEVADFVDELYNSVLENGTFKASSIKTAEAAKILENTQRDINIAFMNESAKIFKVLGLDMREVLRAAGTKWNFMQVQPGLVGGHCISVDPYYWIYQAKTSGVSPDLVIESRKINEGMSSYIAGEVISLLGERNIRPENARVLLLGFSYKENSPDIRNTKVAGIYNYLRDHRVDVVVCDPCIDCEKAEREYGIDVLGEAPECTAAFDAVVVCVAHNAFKPLNIRGFLKRDGLIYDVTHRFGIADYHL